MPTYFSINDGNFSNGLATVVGDVSAAGTSGFLLTTSYSYPTTLATTPNPENPIYGVAFQLSAVSGSPTGTIDLILSATNGASTTASFPISGLTQKSGLRSSITPTNPVGWQVFAFNSPVTFPTGRSMRIGVKTSVSNKVSLIGASLTNLNRSYITTLTGNPASVADVVHIVGSLSSTGLVTRTVNYNVAGPVTYGNFYVHNGGVLNFDPTISTTITLAGTLGMQITPDGTVNIGTSSSPVLSSVTHSINLSNSYINVHNGASFNVYGAYKTPYLLFSADTTIGNNVYNTTTDPTDWIIGDSLVLTPNVNSYNTTEATTLLLKPASFTIQASTIYVHNSSNYIPSAVNMTRNVQISANSGYIRFLDGSNSNVNNAQFKGFRNATYKGLQFCTDSTGSVSLSNCAFNGDAVATMPAFSFDSAKTPTSNVSIMGCNFFGYGATTDIITLNAVSANNFTFTNNIVLSASQNGMLINALSSTYANIKNNFLIGNVQNGLRVINPYVLSGGIGGIGCMNNVWGCVVSGSNNRANYDGLIGHYNNREGVYISGTIPQLSSTNFLNLAANNNKTSGVLLSGNSTNLLTPIKVNINGLVANNNGDTGLKGYAITGNLSSMSFLNNKNGGMKISIGNADTIFDGITSTNDGTFYLNSFGPSGVIGPDVNYPYASPFGGVVDGNALFPASTTTQYLSTLDDNLSFSGDFTIETWFTTTNGTLDTKARRIFGFGSNVANGLQLIQGTADAVAASTLTVFTSASLITGSVPVDVGGWFHVAISRVSGIIRLFINGVQDGEEVENTTNFNAGLTSPLFIGKFAGAGNGRFHGYMSNFRILNNTGLYSSNFTPPSAAPFTIIPNTTLLFNGTDYINRTYKSLPNSNIDILSGRNYSATLFKNSNLKGDLVNAIKLNSTKFEQFSMDSTTLSSNVEDIASTSDVDFLQGSYQFNNCTFGSGILSSTIENYQPEVFTENGFVVMKENSVANIHYRLLRAGKISLDTTVVKSPNTVSEKLEPKSIITKLRCGSKMIPVNKDDSYTVGCYVYKSSGYSGDAPRLVLKHNSAIGYQDTILATSVGADETWEYLSGTVPAALDQGIFEVYVDCSGESGSGSVNISDWTLTLV